MKNLSWLALPLAVGLALCQASAQTEQNINQAIRRVDVDQRVVALTFDDGPDGGCMPYVKLFKKEQVKATFFVVGRKVDEAPKIVRALHDAGMEIGNHTYSQGIMTELSPDQVRDETIRTQDAVEAVTGLAPRVYRASSLKYNQNVWDVLTDLQLPAINASISAGDWKKDKSAEAIYQTLTTDVKPGDILLMHSWSEKTLSVMPRVIDHLKSQGFGFVTVSELLAMSKTPLYQPLAGQKLAPAGTAQLLKNPTLRDESGDGLPDGWWKLTQRQGTGDKHDGEPRFLRLGIQNAGQSCIFQQFVDLPEGGGPITVAAKVRWSGIQRGGKNYMTGCVQAMFADQQDKKAGDHLAVHQMTGSAERWRVVQKTFTPPDGATRVRIQAALYSVKSGTLDVAWVTVAPGDQPVEPSAEERARAHAPTTHPHKFTLDRIPLPAGNGPEYGGVKGVSLLGEEALVTLQPYRNLDKWRLERVAVEEGQPFSEAVRVTVLEQPAAVWDMQLRAKVGVPVNKGDVLHLTFWTRGIENSAEFAETSFLTALQLDREPWTSVFGFRPKAGVGKGWRKIQRVFVSPATYDVNELAFSLQFGLEPQTFEVAGLSCYNYGHTIDADELPKLKPPLYAGHEPDAPWRAEAAERIEKIRKADLTVSVVDGDGAPVAGAEVKVEMTGHAFGWGSALYIWAFAGESEKAETYRAKFLELFNLVVPENGLKWNTWEQEKARNNTLAMVRWARENNCEVRGHTLVWPSWKRSPQRLQEFKNNPEQLREEIRKHIEDIVLATKGQIKEWDVFNEPTTNYDFMELLGEDAPAEWMKQAETLDPDARMFLNENQILAGTKIKSLELYLDKLLKYGAPLEGIGIQGHLGVGTASPEKMLKIYDRLSRYNVPLAITELDVLTDNPELQAMYLRDVLICAFSHPRVDSVTFWGFWDGRHWKKNSPLYRADWTPKPGLEVYRKLVFGDWWTDQTVKTDADGRATVRGFLGSYTVRATAGERAAETVTELPAAGQELAVTIR